MYILDISYAAHSNGRLRVGEMDVDMPDVISNVETACLQTLSGLGIPVQRRLPGRIWRGKAHCADPLAFIVALAERFGRRNQRGASQRVRCICPFLNTSGNLANDA